MYPQPIQQWCTENPSYRHHIEQQEMLVGIDISAQRLNLFYQSKLKACYPVSTSRKGVGTVENSFCTSLGLHEIAEEIGDNSLAGEVFIARQAQGRVFDQEDIKDDKDLITLRILWLRGLQPGVNSGDKCDSYQRYIYIHGTADEVHIGQPMSIGCIRMRNDDVIDFFSRVAVGCRVLIY